ncbi:hypothetical protein [Paenibacillus sp. MMS18-CY102]|uniref:hypothetical protein n=1 Tax=Paenibacillus sp. MMS18-CY102 TaxID=2682849 RepID=UPI0013662D5D|nr:hypothetical protein [Paenibacillus sp. MMS18-CY102]MWC27623.1 hypothetical protein [Paenibacillus sp. MMS18-CY102]
MRIFPGLSLIADDDSPAAKSPIPAYVVHLVGIMLLGIILLRIMQHSMMHSGLIARNHLT